MLLYKLNRTSQEAAPVAEEGNQRENGAQQERRGIPLPPDINTHPPLAGGTHQPPSLLRSGGPGSDCTLALCVAGFCSWCCRSGARAASADEPSPPGGRRTLCRCSWCAALPSACPGEGVCGWPGSLLLLVPLLLREGRLLLCKRLLLRKRRLLLQRCLLRKWLLLWLLLLAQVRLPVGCKWRVRQVAERAVRRPAVGKGGARGRRGGAAWDHLVFAWPQLVLLQGSRGAEGNKCQCMVGRKRACSSCLLLQDRCGQQPCKRMVGRKPACRSNCCTKAASYWEK